MSGIMLRLKNTKFAQNQRGAINGLLLPFVLVLLLFIGAVSFGYWAFMSRQDYKNNTDQKVAVAVAAATKQQSAVDTTNYDQAEKNPLRTYNGPAAYGSLSIQYPKTWSGYVAIAPDSGSSTPINGYFQPSVVPNIDDPASVYALRVEVTQTPYSQVLTSYTSQVANKQVTVTPYALPKVPSVVGVRVDGAIQQNIQGSMIILPLRATTLQIWTESTAEESDFNTIILPNLSFSP
jgi:hypothetical protein